MKFIVLAIPGFFILIGLELIIDKLKKTHLYRLNDAVTNISLGIGSQITGLFLKFFTVLAYAYIYEHWRLFEIRENAFTVFLLFIGVDFFYYWFHRLAHELAVLWGSHVVHHQSEEYNLTVALRQSWTQGMFSWVFYLPLAFMGFNTYTFIMISAFQTLYQFWIHTRLVNKLPASLEFILNTPSHHRVHHGQNPKYIDRNHAGTLIIWDRMFGTFQEEEEEVVYGITTPPASWNPIWLNLDYYIDLWKSFLSMPGLLNKIRMLFHQPGWKPAELGGPEPLKNVSTSTFHKYDVSIPAGLNYYVIVQFIIILGFTSLFLNIAEKEPFANNWVFKLAISVSLIISITSLGTILDDRKWAPALESGRLMLQGIAFVYVFYLMQKTLLLPLILVVCMIQIFSFVWFIRYRRHYVSLPENTMAKEA